jgi:hypothetical protein
MAAVAGAAEMQGVGERQKQAKRSDIHAGVFQFGISIFGILCCEYIILRNTGYGLW